jgi:hypothetical protein
MASPDQAADESAEQSLAAATGVVHELAEPEIQRQFVLRDAAVRAQPGTQQRPEALDGVDVDFENPSPSSSRAYSPWAWQTVLWP